MTLPLISVQNATLEYPIGGLGGRSIKSDLFNVGKGARGRGAPQSYRALSNVSFEVSPGERVAILGSNGSGKTTLLRALAGLYPLAEGRIATRGSVRALFEIGIGMDMEESGRANIYNRGYTMGFSRKQIRDLEEDIVEFADIGEFIDMPMKTYSAGMQIRVMFSIATAFPAQILLLDEFISAGDANFLSRAHSRLLSALGRAECFVTATHTLGMAQEVCTRCIGLSRGVVIMDGDPKAVVDCYTQWAARVAA